MSLFTVKMKMLTAVVLDGYSDKVVKALLEEGVMDFVHISQLDSDQAQRLSSHRADVPQGTISDLRGRCENLLRQGNIDLPSINKAEVDSLGRFNAEECRTLLDGLSGKINELRDKQKNCNQKLLAYSELLSYIKEKKTDYLDLRYGKISEDRKPEDLAARLSSYCAVTGQDEKGWLVSLSLRRDSSRISEVMDKFGWTENPHGSKTAMTLASSLVSQKIEEYQKEIDQLVLQISQLIRKDEAQLSKMWIMLRVSELSEHVESYFSYTKNTTLFSGWVPASRAGEIETVIYEASKGKCIIEWTDDSEVDRDKIPTSVDSARILAPFARMVSNYGTPEYGSVNPTPFTTVAYIVMFALMFADVGQGLVIGGLVGRMLVGTHQLAVQVGEQDDDVSVDLQVSGLLHSLFPHHPDEVGIPLLDFLLRIGSGTELCEVIPPEFLRVQMVGAEDVFHLPHVEQVFGDVFLFQSLGDIHCYNPNESVSAKSVRSG